MSDRPTPETDAIECKVVFWQMTEHAKKLERQRDAAVEALLHLRVKIDETHDLHAVFNIKDCEEFARAKAVIREIEGKS